MDEPATPNAPTASSEWSRAEIVYAVVLFAFAAGLLAFAIARTGGLLPNHGIGDALLFLGYGLFTISVGYRHPNFGYYSFDRVAQVASILVLGPVDAAWINGLASLLYPWHRLWKGVPLRNVIYAALNNSGLMTLIILASGYLYTMLDGRVPLVSMTGWSVVPLIVLVLGIQLLNDVGMLGLLRLGGRGLAGFFNVFSYAIELGSGATAVLVAVVYNSMDAAVLVLLLGVLSLGMLALRQFADMRYKLELIVEERTKSLREKTKELELQATRDNLTNLFNRRYADRYLEQNLETAESYEQHFTIALADIDLFKQINDLHSHATGDEVLRRVARILRERCRQTDMIARYGGEEFLICFPHTDLRQARVLCEELRSSIERTNWSPLGLAAGVTISFGIAERRADSSPDSLLNTADLRLYSAKNNGRNRVVA
jgi:diguanylate cyclase (GGDEF)-like protein